MKLNMWMIANRLQAYDIEKRLDSNAPAVINSALPIYASNCVRIRAVDGDVLCEHDQGYIRIHDLSLNNGYMLIQGIFDWYQDWMDRMDHALIDRDYDRWVKTCYQAFGNPVMMQDANYQLLGLYADFRPGEECAEWELIRTQGQSSVTGYNHMAKLLQNPTALYANHVRRFQGIPGSCMPYSGLHAAIRFNNRDYCKLTVLEYNRTLNPGDVCLMERLALRTSIYHAASYSNEDILDNQILSRLLSKQSVPTNQVQYYQDLVSGGRDGSFALLSIKFLDQKSSTGGAIALLRNIITVHFPAAICCSFQDTLVLLLFSTDPTVLAQQQMNLLHLSGYEGKIRAGLSLPFKNLRHADSFYHQSLWAVDKRNEPGLRIFYNCASDYMLHCNDDTLRLHACEPALSKIWHEEPDKRDYIRSLFVYLEYERAATIAAEQLYVHKNTLNYRIKYLRERTGWDLNDPKLRTYLRLSYRFLSEIEL